MARRALRPRHQLHPQRDRLREEHEDEGGAHQTAFTDGHNERADADSHGKIDDQQRADADSHEIDRAQHGADSEQRADADSEQRADADSHGKTEMQENANREDSEKRKVHVKIANRGNMPIDMDQQAVKSVGVADISPALEKEDAKVVR